MKYLLLPLFLLQATFIKAPVNLVSFTATAMENNVELNWITDTELNNRGSQIERSINGVDFQNIGFVAGHGTTTDIQNYSYIDQNVAAGTYSYRLKQIDYDGSITYSQEIEIDVKLPNVFELEQNYPNPFNPVTTIKYNLPKASEVALTIYDVLGREIKTIVNEQQQPGSYEVNWNASNISSGIYFYQLKTNDYVNTKKMLLLK